MALADRPSRDRPRRLLFVAEAVTLAQVVRLAKLAGGLDPARFDVHFAAAHFDPLVFGRSSFTCHRIQSISSSVIERRVRTGRRLYGYSTLVDYAASDLALIRRLRPALVIGDFRLSLQVSAAVAGVPLATLINAYWSPYRLEDDFPLPDHPIISILGERLTARYFPHALPRVFDHFARPVERLRARFGLPPGGSLLETLTNGDYTLYPDHPSLTPLKADAPASHRFIGPIVWSAPVEMPEMSDVADDRPLVYVTLGSSGRVDILPLVVAALGPLPVEVVVSTAGRTKLRHFPPNVRVVDFVPGDALARRASVVVSNGGSTTGYQALCQGTPVVGLPSNLDQYLAMRAIERAGGGVLLPARSLTAHSLQEAVQAVLSSGDFRRAATKVREAFRQLNSGVEFQRLLESIFERPRKEVTAHAQ